MLPDAVEWDQVSEFDTIDFPEWLVGDVRDPFALHVTGVSMIDAGIMEDDIIIMEKTNRARRGDMVIAYVQSREEHTVKRYYPNGPSVTLQPENRNHDPMIEDATDVSIEGKVVAVVRRY